MSGCSVYTPPPDLDNDVTPMTSLQVQGVSQLTSSFAVPYTDGSGILPAMNGHVPSNDVTAVYGVLQPVTSLGISCGGDVHAGAWGETAMMRGHRASSTASPVISGRQTLQLVCGNLNPMNRHPLLFPASSTTSDDDETNDNEVFSASLTHFVTHSALPPTPPESQSSSPGVDFPTTVPPPPYPTPQPTRSAARKTMPSGPCPPAYPVPSASTESGVPETLLTPVTKRPRLTHKGCSTFWYRSRNNKPDTTEKPRNHLCPYPGMMMMMMMNDT